MAEEVNWDEAVASSGFIRLEQDESKELVLTNWKIQKVEKFGETQIEFSADCVEEDGEVVEKLFNTSSNRLKRKLRPIFEGKDNGDKVKISVLKVGDKFDTQYSVKEL